MTRRGGLYQIAEVPLFKELVEQAAPVAETPPKTKPVKAITKAQRAIVDAGAEIRMDRPILEDAAYLARQFVQATLPHSDPKADRWRRVNGRFALGINAGFNPASGETYGLPYGIIPRLLLFWITTEAVKTKNPRLQLGRSLAQFMKEVGLNPNTGGGKRSDAKRLHDQMQRLFSAVITFTNDLQRGAGRGQEVLDLKVSNHRVLWWKPATPDQNTLWESYVDLTQEFFEAVTASPVPVDTRALRALKRSPLALDLYALCCYEAWRIERTGKTRVIPWRALMQQLGAEYQGNDSMKAADNFAQKCKAALRKVQTVMPSLKLGNVKGGLAILPTSLPAIPSKLPAER